MTILTKNEDSQTVRLRINHNMCKFSSDDGSFYEGIHGDLLGFSISKKQYGNEVYELFNVWIGIDKTYMLQINLNTYLCFILLNSLLSLPDYSGDIQLNLIKRQNKYVNIYVKQKDEEVGWKYKMNELDINNDKDKTAIKRKWINELILKAPYAG